MAGVAELGGDVLVLIGADLGSEVVAGSGGIPFPEAGEHGGDRGDGEESFNLRPWLVFRNSEIAGKIQREDGEIWEERKDGGGEEQEGKRS